MRDKFGLAISIIIALSLLYFIAPMDDLMNMFGARKNTVGVISDKKISYEDFNQEAEKFKTVARFTGNNTADETMNRNMAWEYFIYRYLFVENAKKAGIRVGEAEMLDCLSGDHISPVLTSNGIFNDRSGNFSREILNMLVQGVGENPEYATFWKYLQNTVNIQQYVNKYSSLFVNGNFCSKPLAEAEMAFNNTSVDVEYVEYQYPFITDTTIVVKDSEIKAYYNEHKKNYKQNDSRDMEFVLFEITPSAADVAKTSDKINEVYDEFVSTDNIKKFLSSNSDKPYDGKWYKKGGLNIVSRQLENEIFTEGKNVSGIVKDQDSFRAARVMESAMVPDSVYVSHILLQGADVAKADSLLKVLKGGASFSDLAARFSADQGSADGGVKGNIGWFTQDYMVPGFEPALTAKLGTPFTLKTTYGTHIVLVSKRSAPVAKKKVAILEKNAFPSSETHNVIYAEAKKLAVMAAGKYDAYKNAVDSLGLYSQKRSKVQENNTRYGSAEDAAKAVTRWAFDNGKGKVSDVIEIGGYYVVAAVTGVHKEGYTPVSEVSAGIKNILYSKKLHEKVQAEVAEKIEGKTTIAEVAEVLGQEVSKSENASLASTSGEFEPALAGALLVAPEGEVSAPVQGSRAVYVFVVSNHQTGSFSTLEDVKEEMARKAQYTTRMIEPVMSEAADVKDNRAKFF